MSIIVEDGTGKSDAESYCTVAYCDDYFSKRNNTSWAALDTETKEGCLRLATDYMVQIYRNKWNGRRVLTTQSLDWPRVGVVISDFTQTQFTSYGLFQVDYTIVPEEVKKACAELANRASIAVLSVDQTQSVTEETVGPITVKYDTNSPDIVRYNVIDNLLKVYMSSGGSNAMVRLVRV